MNLSSAFRRATLFCLLIPILQCTSDKEGISVKDVRSAQKLIGIDFNDAELDTLTSYLDENRAGYDSMRKHSLNYEVAPAIYFDPRPDNFLPQVSEGKTDWKLPDNVALPESDEAIAMLTVAELASLIKDRKITATRLTQIYLGRLKKYNDTLQATITITEDLALRQAAIADQEISEGRYRGPLHGIPYGIKDLFSVPGYKTTWGAAPYKDQVLEQTAGVVKKLEAAGAVLVAKLVSGALARGDVWFGGKAKNPWDLKQGASGSSAGPGSATAAGLVGFSIGTETLGSIISPSTRCGITGLRPTFGRVSRSGGMSLAWSMDKVGPMCRSAQDCALVFSVILGKTDELETDRAVMDHPFFFHPPQDLAGYKIGYFKHLFDKDTTRNGVNNAASLERLKALGANLEEVVLPSEVPYDVFDVILRSEAGSFFDELVLSHEDRTMVEQHKRSRANSLRQSRFIPAVEYLQANRFRKLLIEEFNAMSKSYDFIVAPTFGRNLSMATNLTGHPAIAIPNGFDKAGHPTSITLIANLYDEQVILEAAYIIQQNTTHHKQHPERFMSKMK